jgi:hypothetical protein
MNRINRLLVIYWYFHILILFTLIFVRNKLLYIYIQYVQISIVCTPNAPMRNTIPSFRLNLFIVCTSPVTSIYSYYFILLIKTHKSLYPCTQFKHYIILSSFNYMSFHKSILVVYYRLYLVLITLNIMILKWTKNMWIHGPVLYSHDSNIIYILYIMKMKGRPLSLESGRVKLSGGRKLC